MMNQQPEPLPCPDHDGKLIPIVLDQPMPVSYCDIPVQAGIPISCLRDQQEKEDLRTLLKLNDTSSLISVRGDSMTDMGIHDGDILIVDRSSYAEDGQVIIALFNGGSTVKEYHRDTDTGAVSLIPHNPIYHPIQVDPKRDYFRIEGIVKKIIHDL